MDQLWELSVALMKAKPTDSHEGKDDEAFETGSEESTTQEP